MYNNYTNVTFKKGVNIMEDCEICRCMGVSFSDIYNAMNALTGFKDADDIIRQLEEKTGCGTGCGRCRNEIKLLISDIINGYADPPHHHHHEHEV